MGHAPVFFDEAQVTGILNVVMQGIGSGRLELMMGSVDFKLPLVYRRPAATQARESLAA